MQVNAAVSEADIGRIQAGQVARFRVDAYPDRTFSGTVSQVRLEPVVEQNVVSYVTVIDVANSDLALKPGMTANVTVEIARAANVLRVPLAALRVRPSAEVLAAYGASATTGDPRPTAHGACLRLCPPRRTTGAGAARWFGHAAAAARTRLGAGRRPACSAVVVDVGITDGQNVGDPR